MNTITNNMFSRRIPGSSTLLALLIVASAFVMGIATPQVAVAAYSDGYCTGCGATGDYSFPSYSYSDYSVPSYSYSDYSFPSYSYSDYSMPSYSYSDYSFPSYSYSDYDFPSYSYSDYSVPSYSYSDYDYPTTDYSYYTPQPMYDYYQEESYYIYDDYDYSWTPSRPSYDEPRCALIVEDKTLTRGQSTTLTWETEDVDYATLSGFGSVNERGGSERISPNRTTTYNLSVEGRGGSDDCYITVTVDEEDEEDVRCELSVSDTTIEEDQEVTLRWNTEGARSVHINQGIGSVSRSGSERVSPNRDTTYTLTVEDNRGNEDDCSVTVRVEDEDEDNLQCELTASDRSIEEGDDTTLRWDTRGNVDEARINQGIGSVDEDGGTERVRPNRDTRYILTIENDEGDEEECSVTIDVEDGLAPPPDVPLVYLSQLPYTGVEDNMAYWLLLIVGSGVLGYAFFYRALPFALARVKMLKSEDVAAPAEADVAADAVPANVTRQDVRAFVSAIAEGDAGSAMEFARTSGAVLFAETAVVLDDVIRARESGGSADPAIASMTTGWDGDKFAKLIEAFANATDEDAAVTEAITA